jgi:hypothetical protein
MNKVIAVLGGIGLGAALMFLYDPKDGQKRRALIRDKANGLGSEARGALGKKTRRWGNRAQGLIQEAKARLASRDAGENTETAAPTV